MMSPVEVRTLASIQGSRCEAAVGEDGVGAGHIQRRGVIGADGHGGRSLHALDAGVAGQRATWSKPTMEARLMVALFSERSRASRAVTSP